MIPSSVNIKDNAQLVKYLDKATSGDFDFNDIPYAVIRVELRETDAWKDW